MVAKLSYKIICIAILLITCLIVSIIFFVNKSSSKTQALPQKDYISLPIIMYHEIKTFKLGKDVITPYEFESDLNFLSLNGYNTINMTQLIEYVYNNTNLPSNPIIISFDDGYLNNYKYGYPLLKKYNMKIVLSVIGKNTDDFTRIPDNNIDYSHVTWDQLNEMLSSGYVEVQNHTYNLHSIGRRRVGCMQMSGESIDSYEKILTEDVGGLQKKLTELTGNTPNTFTYPYGQFNKNTNEVLKKLGFKATLSCKYGINKITKNKEDLYELKRICRSHGYSIEKVLKDGYKALK